MLVRKIMLLGEMGVGKTSIIKRLMFDTFDEDYVSSIGTDIFRYEVVAPGSGQPVMFTVWDTDGSFGEAIFKSVYIRGAHAAVIVGDVTRPGTLATMARLATTFEDELPGRYFRCVTNKIDLLDDADTWTPPDAVQRAELPVIRSSAKTGDNVTAIFEHAADAMVRRA
jgi:small GTP-binding protein